MESQSGGLLSEYDMGEDDEKVEEEKTNENGVSILAIGGTWALIGKSMVGVASALWSRAARAARAQRLTNVAILEVVTASSWNLHEDSR